MAGILALVPLVLSCASSASVRGMLVPRGSMDKRIDEAVVYLETADSALVGRFAAWDDRVRLTFAGGKLQPAVLVATVGSSLEIWNDDGVFHQPFTRSQAAPLDGSSVRPTTGTVVRLRSKGVVQIFCQLHDGESAEVLVLDNSLWTRPDTTGAFRFTHLPRGRYVVHAWHPRFGQQKLPIDVEKSGPMSVELRY